MRLRDRSLLTRRETLLGALGLACMPMSRAGADEGAGWTPGPSLPYPVQEIYPTLHEGRIVIAGGFRRRAFGHLSPTDEVIAFDLKKASWGRLPTLPAARHHPLLVSFKGALLSVGGFAATPLAIWQMSAGVNVLGEASLAWEPLADLPSPQAEVAAGVIDGRLCVAGGRTPKGDSNGDYGDHVDTGRLLVLDEVKGAWREARPMPTARNSAAGAVIDGRLHVVGGRILTPSGNSNLSAHEVYDPSADRWESLRPMPLAQGGLAAAAVGGRLHVFGGEAFLPERKVFAEGWVYDPLADEWAALPAMPTPRHGLGAVAHEGRIHVVGGATKAGGEGTSEAHEIFTPGDAG